MLRERPTGGITPATFANETCQRSVLNDGEALVEVVWLGIDATQRTWLNLEATYVTPVGVGEVMRGSGVGRVVASRSPALTEGQWVYGNLGWREYTVAGEGGLLGINPVPEGVNPRHLLPVFGVSGLTAYFGMTRVLEVTAGDTVLVTGAAGSVGSLAGQIAHLLGARVIGTTSSTEKVDWVLGVAGFDACANYHSDDLPNALGSFAPEGLTAVFDNVGGRTLEHALDCLAVHGRVALCGAISSGYTAAGYGNGPGNYMQLAFQRARMEGFVFLDFQAHFAEALMRPAAWLAAVDLRWAEDVIDGLHNAPTALQRLFDGANLGKQLVRVSSAGSEVS